VRRRGRKEPCYLTTGHFDIRGGGLHSLQEHIAAYGQVIERLDEGYEGARSSLDYFRLLEAIVPVERACKNQLAALQGAREVVDDKDVITLRDSAATIARNAELLHADARHGLEYAMAKQGEEQARISQSMATAGHRLNLIAAVFLPLTALGSMLGMNMRSGLEAQPVWLFWVVFAVGMMVGGALGLFLARGDNKVVA
jgi:hypothetical protein